MKKVPLILIASAGAWLTLLPAPQTWACGQGSCTITNLPSLAGSVVAVSGINAAGQATGFSYTSVDHGGNAFIYANGLLTSLRTLGGAVSAGYAINSSGQVVGESTLPGENETHAFLYDGTQLLDLGTLGGSYSTASGINDVGQVAGTSDLPDYTTSAFLYRDGLLMPGGDLGGQASQAVAINNLGTLVGNALTTDYACHGFMFRNNRTVDLGTLGGTYSFVYALNEADMVVGESSSTSGETHAFLYNGEPMTDLGTLGGGYSSARALNDAGQIIGVSSTATGQSHGFSCVNGRMTDLGTLGGSVCTPVAINSLGQVVGYSSTAAGQNHAFLWQNGTMTDLNSLLPPDSGWVLSSGDFITDSGQIVGSGVSNGVFQPFLLTPSTVNHPPLANAGPDQTAECQSQISLDGSKSSDPDDDPLTFEWSVLGTTLGTGPTLTASFPLGTHLVTLKVTDPCGESSLATLLVNIVDTLPPTVVCPQEITAAADSQCQAPIPDVTVMVTATDACAPQDNLVISQDPSAGTAVGLGTHPITITVTDASGNKADCSVPFTVKDTAAPLVQTVNATPSVLSPPNHDLVPITARVLASDNCDPAPVSRIVSITADEALLPGEAVITGDLTASLAATRDPSGSGRTYTLQIECVDASGNASTGTTQVFVPRGNGNGGDHPRVKNR